MPIKTKYEIFSSLKKAPVFSTFDRTMAKIEFNDCIHRMQEEIFRMVQTPIPDGALTKSEEYLMLVWRVRQLQRQYFNHGRDFNVMKIALDHEQQLDNWNKQTQAFLDAHPGFPVKDQESHSFFVLVSSWRKAWLEKKKYSNRKMRDEAVLAEMRHKCDDLQNAIDKYLTRKLQLL